MDIDKFWNEIAYSYHGISELSQAHQDKYNYIIDLIFKYNCKKILDLGCGSGIIENKLLERGYNGKVLAIDSSSEMLKIAINNNKSSNVVFRQLNIETIINDPSINTKQYDCCLLINVMFNLTDVSELLSKISNLLITHGLLIIVEPKEKSSVYQFIKRQMNCQGARVTLKLFFKPSVIKNLFIIIWGQFKIDNYYKKKNRHQDKSINELYNKLRLTKYLIKETSSIQANQNILIAAIKSNV